MMITIKRAKCEGGANGFSEFVFRLSLVPVIDLLREKFSAIRNAVTIPTRPALVFLLLALGAVRTAQGQIDPERRRLLQMGFNQPIEGRGPIAAYAFFYYNQPNFLYTNLTLRAAIAPVYLDTELGFSGLLGS